jgi:hypothetical protein
MRERSKLNRKIIIEFLDSKVKVFATLQEKDEPELCEKFWKVLEKPIKMICHHTLSTGQLFTGSGRPPIHPVEVGSQANPIGRKHLLLSKFDPGMLVYVGGHEVAICYGPLITEPLLASGSVVTKVDNESLNDLMKAGMSVWNSEYITHCLITMTITRKEE